MCGFYTKEKYMICQTSIKLIQVVLRQSLTLREKMEPRHLKMQDILLMLKRKWKPIVLANYSKKEFLLSLNKLLSIIKLETSGFLSTTKSMTYLILSIQVKIKYWRNNVNFRRYWNFSIEFRSRCFLIVWRYQSLRKSSEA